MKNSIKRIPVFIALSVGLLFYGLFSTLLSVVLVHLTSIFKLSYSVSSLIHLTFFLTYIIASIPASSLVKKHGYKLNLIIGYFTTGLGCMLFYFGISTQSYPLLIGSIVVMAIGSTILLVICNLYIVLLGDYKYAASRLSIIHAFYAIGCFLAPLYGSELILKLWGITNDISLQQLSLYVETPFIIISNLMFILTVAFVFLNLPEFDTKVLEPWNQFDEGHRKVHVMHFKQLRLGAFAVFAYIGTEVAISDWLVHNYKEFSQVYWGGYLVGLIIGSILLYFFPPKKMLFAFASAALMLLTTSLFVSSGALLWVVSTIGLFNSILFPTIWSLAVKGLGRFAENGAAIMVMAHVGGGIIPFNVVNFASAVGYQIAFIIPIICYGYIIFYALRGSKFQRKVDIKRSTMLAIRPSK